VEVDSSGEWKSSASKYLTETERSEASRLLGAEPGDLLLFAAGYGHGPSKVLGKYEHEDLQAFTS
jgi:hypothetical protein